MGDEGEGVAVAALLIALFGGMGVCCGGVFLLKPDSSFNERAKRAEVPSHVDGIKTALMAYDAAFDTFGEGDLPMNPRPKKALSPKTAKWVHRPDWDALGWQPDGDVRGTYWVDVNDAGTDFTVYGAIDCDGDGTVAMYTATKSINTVFLNANDTY